MIGQRYPGIAGLRMNDERLMGGNLYQVRYRWRGQEYATVVEADDPDQAAEDFKRDNPHVKFERVTGSDDV